MRPAAFFLRYRRLLTGGGIALGVLLVAALLVLSFGWAYLRRPLEHAFSRQLGRPVTIASVRRTDRSFLHPVIELGGIRIAQPDWVGGGDIVTIRRAIVRLRLLPMLLGQAKPQAVTLDGARVNLIRRDKDHANWQGMSGGGSKRGASFPPLVVRDTVLTLNDAKQDHRFAARLAADANGFRLAGRGSLAGHPSTIFVTGGALATNGPWPFRFDYRSAIANGTLTGQMDHPLDLGHFSARARAWGDDLAHLDLLIEAGLPGTQPVRLTAALRHDRPNWAIRDLRMRIGRSDLAGTVTVGQKDGRGTIDADVLARGLDFDDLATDAQLAHGAAQRRIVGPRVLPDTRIDLAKLRGVDATVRFDVRRILSRRPSAFQSVAGTLTLDHGVLTASPLRARLATGQLRGTARVDHARGAPKLALDLRLTGGELDRLIATPDRATGAVQGRAVMAGTGETVRAALARSSGRVALVAQGGTLSRRNALFLGTDAGRALFQDRDTRVPLNCIVANFAVNDGIGRATPLVLDTSVSRVDGRGTISLRDEHMALEVRGHPKLRNAASLDVPVAIIGTLSAPKLIPPEVPKTVGTALKLLGRVIGGNDNPPVGDANCAELAARALR